MARRPPTTYQYGTGDDPITLAEQNGISVQELLAANPGGAPFQTGQTIVLPPPRPTINATGTAGTYQYKPPSWVQPLNLSFNWNGTQYQNQLQQGYQNAGWAGVGVTLPSIAGDIAAEGFNTVQQGINSVTGTVNGVGNAAVSGYQQLYGSVPDEYINSLALVNPALAMSLRNSRPQGARAGKPARRPGVYQSTIGAPPVGYGPNAWNPQYSAYGTDDSWATGTGTATAPGAQPRPQPQTAPGMPISDNNYMTNPALYNLTWNSSAKNVKNRFNTNLKWAQNAWRRKAGRGMNARRRQEEQQKQQDFTLSNSLIHLGAGSG
jgi:hypothetical protein